MFPPDSKSPFLCCGLFPAFRKKSEPELKVIVGDAIDPVVCPSLCVHRGKHPELFFDQVHALQNVEIGSQKAAVDEAFLSDLAERCCAVGDGIENAVVG